MLKYDLIHPPLLEALGTAGHGSKILLADGNFPYLTVKHSAARLIYLNLAPDLLSVTQVLEILTNAVNFEGATVMAPDDDSAVEAHLDYRRVLGDEVPLASTDRWSFYDLARSADVGLVVATGDRRLFANVVLTIGLR